MCVGCMFCILPFLFFFCFWRFLVVASTLIYNISDITRGLKNLEATFVIFKFGEIFQLLSFENFDKVSFEPINLVW